MKNFNISQQTFPKMKYGYYTPLLNLQKQTQLFDNMISKKVTFAKTTEIFEPSSSSEINPPLLLRGRKLELIDHKEVTNESAKFASQNTRFTLGKKTLCLALISAVAFVSLPLIHDLVNSTNQLPKFTNEPLHATNLSSNDLLTLEARTNTPLAYPAAQFVVPFFANAAGNLTSAFGRLFTLSASEGELPSGLFPLSIEGWSDPTKLTKKHIEALLNRQPINFEQFSTNLDLDPNKPKTRSEYNNYLERFNNSQKELNKAYHHIPKKDLENWFRELNASNRCALGMGYNVPNNAAEYSQERQTSATRNFYPLTPHADYESRSKTTFTVSTNGKFTFQHRGANSHLIGPSKSAWENISLLCTKTLNTINCMSISPIEHLIGKLFYNGTEENMADNCSIIREKATKINGETVFDIVYAIDPRKTLPLFASKVVLVSEFFKNKISTGTPEKPNAKVNTSLKFPLLPATCEELNAQKAS